jgi:DNA-binding NarL/FixJ family response regulator
MMASPLEQGRNAFSRRAWQDAYTHLIAADAGQPLHIDDLERLAIAALLIGRDDEAVDAWTRMHHGCLGQGAVVRAARCGFWLGFTLLLKGQEAHAGGWLARSRRLVDEAQQQDCAERGFLLIPEGLRHLDTGDAASALASFSEAVQIGERCGEIDLVALGRLGSGQSLIAQGDLVRGKALLDDVMVTVLAGETLPTVTGLVYCAVIEACHTIFDLARAREWTTALSQWCEAQPGLVLFRGPCLVHRAEIMRLYGAWPDALREARRACEWLSKPVAHPAIGAAMYQQAELHRLRGELSQSEDAYRQAGQWGHPTEPGLPLLRLAQGHTDAANATLRRALAEARDPTRRSRLLAALVEGALACQDRHAARVYADELAAIAASLSVAYLNATALHAMGTVLLSEGSAAEAIAELREAGIVWQSLELPYEAARTRYHIGLACRVLGDLDGAELELNAARLAFQALGATPDVAGVESVLQKMSDGMSGVLSAREIEVLQLVAAGKTNRAIAADLILSEKTVARHLSNIFSKLGITSRSAATAYAYEHRLV